MIIAINREKKIDQFLKYYAEVYRQNPNYQIDSDVLYGQLEIYGLTDKEVKNRSIQENFQKWINHFNGNPNLKVFHTVNQPYFLQFQSNHNLSGSPVKLYLSYPKDKIERCVNKIFDYIVSQNMATESKVAKEIRSDSIVLRMQNYEDAEKLINFINHDFELSLHAKETNPFLMRKGNVAVAYDDMISYNDLLADLMQIYYQNAREQNTLQNVSHQDFKQFIKQYYIQNFKDTRGIKNFCHSPYFHKYRGRFQTDGEQLHNYEEVVRLIMMSLDGKMSLEDYHRFYKETRNEFQRKQMITYYNQVIFNNYKVRSQREENQDLAKQILDNYIEFAAQKYGKDNISMFLESYVYDRSINAITREEGYREKFETYLNPEQVKKITKNSIPFYIEQILTKKIGINENINNLHSSKELLHQYIDFISTKYGIDQVTYLLQIYVNEKNIKAITRDNDFRTKFLSYLPPEEVARLTNYQIEGYVRNYIEFKSQTIRTDNDNIEHYQLYLRACEETYRKYGFIQLKGAIAASFSGLYHHFTNGTEEFQTKMIKMISANEIGDFCQRILREYGGDIGNNNDIADACAKAIETKLNLQNGTLGRTIK